MKTPLRLALCATGLLGLAGCAVVPQKIAGEVASTDPAAGGWTTGSSVRWGGELLATTPLEDHTCFEILSRPLETGGRPRYHSDDAAGPRFLACQPGFVDPETHMKGAQVTVMGQVVTVRTGQVGEHKFSQPVVEAAGVQWWQPRPDPYAYPSYWGPWGPGFYRDPFFPGGYGWGPGYYGGYYRVHPSGGWHGNGGWHGAVPHAPAGAPLHR